MHFIFHFIFNGILIIPYTETAWNNVSIDENVLATEFNTTSNGKFCISATTQPVSCDNDGIVTLT